MNIAFWSPTPFSGRKSTNMLLLALEAVRESGREQLLLHADVRGSGPEHFLLSGTHRLRMMEYREFGLELLDKQLHCERFDKSLVVNASYSFLNGLIHVLPPGGEFFYRRDEDAVAESVNALMKRLSLEFENVFLEVPAGDSLYARRLCEAADAVVVNLSQSPVELYRINEIPHFEKTRYVLGAYEKNSMYAIHNIERMWPQTKGCLAGIPYDDRLLTTALRGDALLFYTRGQTEDNAEYEYTFFRELSKAFQLLMGKDREYA